MSQILARIRARGVMSQIWAQTTLWALAPAALASASLAPALARHHCPSAHTTLMTATMPWNHTTHHTRTHMRPPPPLPRHHTPFSQNWIHRFSELDSQISELDSQILGSEPGAMPPTHPGCASLEEDGGSAGALAPGILARAVGRLRRGLRPRPTHRGGRGCAGGVAPGLFAQWLVAAAPGS